jgi:hypothetical protein
MTTMDEAKKRETKVEDEMWREGGRMEGWTCEWESERVGKSNVSR